MIYQFKEGDTVRMKRSCTDAKEGDILELVNKEGFGLVAKKGKFGCNCKENWQLVETPEDNLLTALDPEKLVLDVAIKVCEQHGMTVLPWTPTIGKEVFVITGRGYVTSFIYDNSAKQNERIAFLGGFRDRKSAEEKRDLIANLK